MDAKTGPLLLEEKKEGVVNLNEGEEWVVPLSFTHLRDEAIIESIKEICRLLGCYGNVSVIVDTLIQEIIGNSINRCEYLLIFHWIIKGVESPHPSLIRIIEWAVEAWEERREGTHSGAVYETCFMLHLIEDVADKLSKHVIIM